MDQLNSGPAVDQPFWEKPLESLDRAQWEALCDGCGKCCTIKAEDEDDGQIYMTNIACRLLDTENARCTDYRRRRFYVPDCIRLTPAKLSNFDWLPDSCAYVKRAAGMPLEHWHHLLSGSRDTIHETGHSVRGKVISEAEAGPVENHILEAPL